MEGNSSKSDGIGGREEEEAYGGGGEGGDDDDGDYYGGVDYNQDYEVIIFDNLYIVMTFIYYFQFVFLAHVEI